MIVSKEENEYEEVSISKYKPSSKKSPKTKYKYHPFPKQIK